MPSKGAPSSPAKRGQVLRTSPSKAGEYIVPAKSISPPRTPFYNKTKSGRATAAERPTIRPVLRETFLDDKTPEDAPKYHGTMSPQDDQDPHDLSFPPRHVARLSMFDNMLQSLDQLSKGSSNITEARPAHPHYNENSETRSRYNITKPTRQRGHTLSSSVSSENDVRNEHTTPHISRSVARLGRSNSNANSSHAQQKLPPILGDEESSARQRAFAAQRAMHPSERVQQVQGEARQSSKGSGSSSIDLSQIIATGAKLGPAGNRRSRSFDFGSIQQKSSFLEAMRQLDAAPTPIIHAGPAARHSPVATTFPAVSMERKNSTKSSKSHYGRKTRSETLGAASSKTKHDQSMEARLKEDPLPSLPTHITSSALASPTFEQQPGEPMPSSRERPGFFRRVFGSSKGTTSTTDQFPNPNRNESGMSQEGDRTHTMDGIAPPNSHTRLIKQSNKRSDSPNVAPIEKGQQTLTKKHSAFFRRRKKSTSDNNPCPMPLKISGLQSDAVHGDHPSPVSSLRQIMNPYLAEARQSVIAMQTVDADDPIVESPQGYHTALTSPVDPQHTPRASEINPLSVNGDLDKPKRRNPPANLQIPDTRYGSKQHVRPNEGNLGSFLADSSSAECSTQSGQHSPSSGSDRPRTSPTGRGPSIASTQTSSTSAAPKLRSRLDLTKPRHDHHAGEVVAPAPSSPSGLGPASELTQLWLRKYSGEQFKPTPSSTDPVGAGILVSRASGSDLSIYRSAPSTPVFVHPDIVEAEEHDKSGLLSEEDYVEQALKLFENRDDTIDPGAAAAWLGDSGPDKECIRKAYMQLFDWSNMNILTSLRGLCDRIALKGETQQVDRMLDSFARRWCECNSNHGFRSNDVVHTICYSILLLNTDLHVAEIGQKMTRAQFVKNTFPTIRHVAEDAKAAATDNARTASPARIDNIYSTPSQSTDVDDNGDDDDTAPTIGLRRPIDRLIREESAELEPAMNDIGPLVTAPHIGSEKGWESQIEIVLKAIYISISRQRLPLFGAGAETTALTQPSSSLLTITGNILRRTPSTLGKGAPDTLRGRQAETRQITGRWTSKTRSRPRLHNSSNLGSSRTSLDEQSSGWSPGMSSTWSKASLNKTLTSMSVESFGSALPRGDYQKSIGFANALSQAIMRDDQLDSESTEEGLRASPLLEDESLAISGAPWAKEGILKHKCHLDSIDKKSKDRNWNDCFAVIEKGWLRLFSFSVNAKFLRQKAKKPDAGGVVGGGNWQDNAEELWKFLLRQTIASALPPPGYAKNRPFVWALSLPNGAVHLFQVGTPDIVKEFVSTANYWSARLSKEPMMGAVSNMEYGWSDAVINRALAGSDSLTAMPAMGPRPSTQSSVRNSADRGSVKPRLPGDKIYINDWTPPQQNTVASQLMEVDQLRALQTYVKNVEDELQKHNELRPAMLLAFSQRYPNSNKAMANWEKKSSYLLREIVKFRTYIDCLQAAQTQKEKIYAMRKEDEKAEEEKTVKMAETLIGA